MKSAEKRRARFDVTLVDRRYLSPGSADFGEKEQTRANRESSDLYDPYPSGDRSVLSASRRRSRSMTIYLTVFTETHSVSERETDSGGLSRITNAKSIVHSAVAARTRFCWLADERTHGEV